MPRADGGIPSASGWMNMLLLLGALLLLAPDLPAQSFHGPLAVRNQFPLFMSLARLQPRSALPQSCFGFAASHSSFFLQEEAGPDSVQLDMELTETSVEVAQQLGHYLEIGLLLPFYSFGPGMLDEGVHFYHESLGLPDAGRRYERKNRFRMRYNQFDVPVWSGVAGRYAPGDLQIHSKTLLWRYRRIALAWLFIWEAPTGSLKQATGNGQTDLANFLLMNYDAGEYWRLYLNIGVSSHKNLRTHTTNGLHFNLDVHDSVQAAIASEFLLGTQWAFLWQTVYSSPVFRHVHIPEMDRPGWLLSIGIRRANKNSFWEASFSEDINTAAAPDFGFQLRWVRNIRGL
ncbi:MAG: DUF3187 family protein [Leptospiraceae bacterium]|nr:DUF3187 family protein [Leptospiraceae bacterium]